ncbi:hypothetical protein LLG95_03800 [bacterium]|nr:hypothetical protein [bacterium]
MLFPVVDRSARQGLAFIPVIFIETEKCPGRRYCPLNELHGFHPGRKELFTAIKSNSLVNIASRSMDILWMNAQG